MKQLKLYLAHCFDDRFEIRRIELEIEKDFNVEIYNPFYDTERDDVRQLDKLGMTRKDVYKKMILWNINKCKSLVERDLNAIQSGDGLLTIIDEASIGTSMEIIACAYFYRKPVFIITTTHSGHPWLRFMAHISGGKMFKNIQQFKRWLGKRGYRAEK
jgi:hypothetical protein